MWEWSYISAILDLGNRWRRVASFTPSSLYPRGKDSQYQLSRRLGGPQSQAGHYEEENILLCQESNPGRPARSLLLYRLSYPEVSMSDGLQWL
jgi:hypothetical protein